MLSEEDKRRIEAEEAYRASLRESRGSEIRKGMKREAGSILFRVIGLFVVMLVSLVGCAIAFH
jgi:hypothetical protein